MIKEITMKRALSSGLKVLALMTLLTGLVSLAAIPVPYTQNFDLYLPPNLPDGWIAVETGESNSIAQTQAENSHSAPNHIILFEGPSDDYVLLALPPVDETVPVRHLSVWWWARSYQDESELQVGILQDPADPSSFFSLTTDIPLTSYWKRYRLSLACYPSTMGRRVAFKSADPNYGGILIDDVELSYNYNTDLEVTHLEVWDPYYVGQNQDYTARVVNQGIQDVYSYSCQLLDGSGNILAQGNQGALWAGFLGGTGFDYNITTPGNHKLSAKVVCAGDLDPSNDESPSRIVKVLAEGAESFGIQNYMQYTGKYPIDLYWKTSMCETLYLASELPQQDKLIHGVKYLSEINTPDIGIKPIQIWMGITTLENLSAGWIPASEMQLVFDGETDFTPGTSPGMFCFPSPFIYTAGSNLAILVLRPLDSQYYSSTDDFYHDNTSIIRTRNVKSDTAIYDPYDPPVASEALTARPVTKLYVTDPITAVDDPVAPALTSLIAWPNPFKQSVHLSWNLMRTAPAELKVYNLKGQMVYRTHITAEPGQNQSCTWDALDSSGNKLPCGIYLLKLSAGQDSETRKVMLVR